MSEDTYEPGSVEDFDRLYRASYRRILFTVYGILGDRPASEDCVQEAFARAFKAWSSWKPEAAAETWLHRIALNVAFTYRRRLRLSEVGEIVRRLGRPEPGPDPAATAERSDLFAALRRLPPDQAAVLILRHHFGYSNREIAFSLGAPESTISSRLVKAKNRLRFLLGVPEGQETPVGRQAGVVTTADSQVLYMENRGAITP